mmetsp:Transcript_21794/g.42296  ORF Transcript_21794/g.42296 Transcript_21794/m.42296 type:complete len:208 (-) Transcript_21794:228-851(-)
MKETLKNSLKNISRRNLLKTSVFISTNISINIAFENKFKVMANNSEIENNAFSTKSGLKIIDFSLGNTERPQWGDFVIINYVMYKSSLGKIDKISDTYQKKTPFLFIHGGGQIIKGIEEAVHSMKKGGKRRVIIPEELGYNVTGLGPIPPENSKRKKLFSQENFSTKDSFIIFDIELLDIKKNDNKQKLFKPTLFQTTENESVEIIK